MEFIKEKEYQGIKRKMNKQDDYFTTEEYTNLLKEYLKTKRNVVKSIFRIVSNLYRGVKNNRFTKEQDLKKLGIGGFANGK